MKPLPASAFLSRFLLLFLLFIQIHTFAQQAGVQYRGEVEGDGDPLTSAYIMLEGTNISTITNSEGEFVLKVPARHTDAAVRISYLGFKTRILPADFFKNGEVEIELEQTAEMLSEVSIFTEEDPRQVVQDMLSRKRENYVIEPAEMRAFYRETIKKGRRNVSLSEAVVNIHKKPYSSYSRDEISLVKARKSADYSRLDTLALKLRGGPFNPLVLDIMKNPDYMFYQEDLMNYEFEFDTPQKINDRYLYVIKFEDRNKSLPWYFGKLYIDAETRALVQADFEMNVENRKVASSMFVKKKPGGTRVYPVFVAYKAKYRQQDGKWYFGYGNAEMEFLINWKRKLFNSRYKVNSELAVTDWVIGAPPVISENLLLDPDVIMADDVTGFVDLNFWGENNIIEPDKSIENAIEKIQKNLED